MQGLQALAGGDVPHLDRRVSVTGHQNVVLQLETGSQRLMAYQRVQASPCLHIPHPYGGVQRAANDVSAIKLHAQRHTHTVIVTCHAEVGWQR